MSTGVDTPRPSSRDGLDTFWLILLLVCTASICIRPAAAVDADLWWHVRAGYWISTHRAIPWQDVLVYGANRPWLDYSWLFDVLVSWLFTVLGPLGILAFTGGMVILAVSSIFDLVSAFLSQGYALLVAALYVLAIAPSATPRPWLFSILFTTLELKLLLQNGKNKRSHLFWLVPLFALWANLHIQFVYGLAVLTLFSASVSARKRVPGIAAMAADIGEWQSWSILAASFVATLANPYGWHLYATVFSYAFQETALSAITEMAALSFRHSTDWAALSLFCFGLASIGWSRTKEPFLIALLGLGAWCGFRSGRDVWFMAAIAAVVGARCLAQRTWPTTLPRIHRLIALTATLCIYGIQVRWGTVSTADLQRETQRAFPVRAAEFIEQHRLSGPLYNPYDWGGYLLWRFPDRAVSIDGRAQIYGDSGLSVALSTDAGQPGWNKNPQLQKARTILLERRCALTSILRIDSSYKLVYEDELATVFVRQM